MQNTCIRQYNKYNHVAHSQSNYNVIKGRQPRTATLTLRFAQFEFQVPVHHKQRSQQQPIHLQVILAAEENPPSDQTTLSTKLHQ